MLRVCFIIFLFISITACKKESATFIYGTVVNEGCSTNSWFVKLDNPVAVKYNFLCAPYPGSGYGYNCTNAVIIMNMPSLLSHSGIRIKFSKWKDKGLMCLSSSYGAHHLASTDVQAE
ncbi:MAG TPA: hypothetical protein VNS32_12020 [Flavisolibacter sp.]|nr:hypothetical protein [Flavisolibacter sp.]